MKKGWGAELRGWRKKGETSGGSLNKGTTNEDSGGEGQKLLLGRLHPAVCYTKGEMG